MSHESCPDCGAERSFYRSSCLACQVRLYARVQSADARAHVVELLRDLAEQRGREHAERVREIALRQRGVTRQKGSQMSSGPATEERSSPTTTKEIA